LFSNIILFSSVHANISAINIPLIKFSGELSQYIPLSKKRNDSFHVPKQPMPDWQMAPFYVSNSPLCVCN